MDRRMNPHFIKLGGSVITEKAKPFTERRDVIARLASEIRASHKGSGLRFVVGHGGGSYPHVPASKYQTHLGLINEESYLGIAYVQDAASRLNRIVVGSLLEEGERAISVQPSAAAVAKDGRIVSWDLRALKMMLELDLVPVPYGDVCMDQARGCSILSTEEVFRYLANELRPSRILIGSDVDGVYDKDPRKYDNAKKIPLITSENFTSVLPSLGGANTVDVTGGMRSKVTSLLELVKTVNVECEIFDISEAGSLMETLGGKRGRGTIIRR